MRLSAETELASLPIAHWPVVLDEMFYIPPPALFPDAPPPPRTIGELAERTRLKVPGVIQYLETILRMQDALEISADELSKLLPQQPVLLDVRERWEYDICHLAGSILLDPETFPALLERLKSEPHVVTVCHHGARSYSAAVYLRQHGVATARSLAGGVDVWARTIDPAMARY